MTDQHLVALLDGRLVPPTMPLLRPDDAGVVRGDGIFESILAVDRVPRDLDEHLERLAVSARLTDLGIPAEPGWRRAVDAALGAWLEGDAVLRLTATRGFGEGPTCYVTAAPVGQAQLDQRAHGARVLTLDRGFAGPEVTKAPWLLAGAKTLSYAVNMAALRYAAAHGADDVIFVGSDGAVLEAPTATVVVARGERTLVTPPNDGILEGITARRLFRAAAAAGWTVTQERLTVADLHEADGVWLASSIRLLAAVTSLDGLARGDRGLTPELLSLLGVQPRS